MKREKRIEINAAIFPYIMRIALSKPLTKDSNAEAVDTLSSSQEIPDIMIDLPRGAYLLYLKNLAKEHNTLELRLLENYAYGVAFSDNDYEELLKLIMVPVDRNWNQNIQGDLLTPFGVKITTDSNGKQKFALLEDAIPTIKVETWECIIIDHLKQAAFDIISCFVFASSFTRKGSNNSNSDELRYDLGAWKFSADISEQSLSNALRSAFMFTLVSYYYGDTKNQYHNFSEFFDAEYYKRVSLVYGIWSNRGSKETIEYIPLYDSFHNLTGIQKSDLIKVLRAILDDPDIALDEKQELKYRLIEGTGVFHHDIDTSDQALEQSLIKPAVNFILLREKAKETLASAEILCSEGKYSDCANRCYYAMMFSLKTLLENKGLLAAWKENELKEAETHKSLESGFSNLVNQGILDANDQSAFDYVKDQRWKCDYSLYKFEKADAENCVKKAKNFYTKVEEITA